MFVESPDGSLYGADGRVVHFSVSRFVRDVVTGGSCFMCGRAESPSVPFDAEHIVPQWLLRRYQMYDQQIQLANKTAVRYGSYTVPCCADCNRGLGKKVEEPVIELLGGGYDAVARRMTDAGRELLYCWCALIFLKTHLKDRALRWHLDRRKGDGMIGEVHNWEAMHHVQSIARCPVVGGRLGRGSMGTLVLARGMTNKHRRRYDHLDFSFACTTMIQIDDLVVFTVLNDSGMCEAALEWYFQKLGTLSPIQVREVSTYLAYTNLRIAEQPRFRTSYDPRTHTLEVEADVPERFSVGPFVAAEYGKMLNVATQDAPLSPEQRQAVLEGQISFTLNDAREFIVHPAME